MKRIHTEIFERAVLPNWCWDKSTDHRLHKAIQYPVYRAVSPAKSRLGRQP